MVKRSTDLYRAVELVLGIVSIAVALVVILNPGYGTATLVSLLAFALLFNAVRLTASGGLSRLPTLLRGIELIGGLATAVIALLAILDPSLGLLTLILLIASGLVIQGAGRLALAAHRGSPRWLRVSALTVGGLTVLLALVGLVDSALAMQSLVALLTVTIAINGLESIVSGVRPSDERQKTLVKLIAFSLFYGFVIINWIDLFATTAPAYHIWLILTELAPFGVLLVFQGLKDWQLALSLAVLVSLVNDLGFYFSGDLFFGFHINLVNWMGHQLGFYGSQLAFTFEGGFFSFPVSSLMMGISIYVRIAFVSVILYHWWTRGSLAKNTKAALP